MLFYYLATNKHLKIGFKALASERIVSGESSERIIEDQAFSPSYILAPSPPLPPHSSVISTAIQRKIEIERKLADRREEPNPTTARKPGPL